VGVLPSLSFLFLGSGKYVMIIKYQIAPISWWDDKNGWKNILNNFRLIIQPFTLFNLIYPWLTVFPIPQLFSGFSKLQSIIYNLTSSIFIFLNHPDLYFSSA
jgi:hypothetical protein